MYKKKILGENLQILRRLCKLSQPYVGYKLGVSSRTIGKIESGKQEPKFSTVLELLEIYEYKGDVRKLYERVFEK